MNFYKSILAVFVLFLVFGGLQVYAGPNDPKERVIPVKIVMDQYFVRNFNRIWAKEMSALPRPPAITAEDFAKDIIGLLTSRHRRYGVSYRVVVIENILAKERVYFEYEYMNLLKNLSCQNSQLMAGFTGAAFLSTSLGSGGPIEVVGSAEHQFGRLFVQLGSLGIIMKPSKDVENMLNTLEHEVFHLFRASHKK